jgi:steroid 5-alpha reductase family enzyme
MPMDVLNNFVVSTGVIAACLVALWAFSLKIKDASIIDIFWGSGFGVIALVCLALAPQTTSYLLLLTALPVIWAVRLSIYLAARNLPHGEDPRYVAMRKAVDPKDWPMWSLKKIYGSQGIAMILVAAPIWIGMALGTGTEIGLLAKLGAVIWLIGFLFEAVGDMQLTKFVKSMKDFKGKYEDKPVLDTGLWKYTRHPNYFGNATMWWGIWLVACQAPWGWVTIFAPAAMTFLLLKITGAAHLERTLKKRPAYNDYIARTSEFFPWFPKSP